MRILVAEDDPITRRLLEAHLTRWEHEVIMCRDGTEAWNALMRDEAPRLAILDWMMPGMDGATICRKIRQKEQQHYIYIILLTARTQKEDLIEGLEAGADDYIAKPFDAHELRVRVRVGSRIIRLQEDLMAALAASEYQASHDVLTSLLNRKAIIEFLQRELARSHRDNTPVSLIMADLDHFKRVNDSYGHLAGDAVLKEVAHRLVTAVRPYDAIGRYGGEEFLIVCPNCDEESSWAIAERLRNLVSEAPLVTPEGSFKVTVSCGVSTVSGSGHNTDSITRAADQALYRAKELGRNRVELHRGELEG
ncbi:MAG: diguanylate cyclase [Desulfomonile tiedjei]|uniref:diguanylate cyclase n=1 Tax=Desulfomonile tiedjei TaxID=2358 RepID=A0A9D6V8P6_9BACT|nr:diguanylate cyclase [Desulfomonile tiedjei]